MYRGRRRPRAGFTLIELLIVVAIIAVLVSLTTAGVMKALDLARDVQNRADMTKLEMALADFKAKHNVYPPSSIKLATKYNLYNQTVALDKESIRYISRMWPKFEWFEVDPVTKQYKTDAGGNKIPRFVNWGNVAGTPDVTYTLEGDQCLVFFLGGIPMSSTSSEKGCLGFSPSPKYPDSMGANSPEKFSEFEPNRLYRRDTNSPFYSYRDRYSDEAAPRPYVYFSSRLAKNGYNGAEVTLGVSPYFRMNGSRREYYNPDTFQLISAGPDHTFGSGGLYDPSSVSLEGEDDQINFGSGEAGTAE